ncbi:unnamed protein product, partial [Discosporangium mesarthrocarpum]
IPHQGALTDLSQTLLGDLPSSGDAATTSVDASIEKAYFCGSDKRMRFDSFPTARVAFAFEVTPETRSTRAVPLMLAQALMGEKLGLRVRV